MAAAYYQIHRKCTIIDPHASIPFIACRLLSGPLLSHQIKRCEALWRKSLANGITNSDFQMQVAEVSDVLMKTMGRSTTVRSK